MASAFDRLERHSFDGLAFPARSVQTRGAQRKKDHEYPGQKGANTEKQNRQLWVWRVEIPAHATFAKYPGLWPDTVEALRDRYEQQKTAEFVIATQGRKLAWITEWDENYSGAIKSGVTLNLTLQEDNSEDFDTKNLVSKVASHLGPATDNLQAAIENVRAQLATQDNAAEFDLFGEIVGLSQEAFAYLDRADIGSQLVEAKLLRLQEIIREADARAQVLLHPDCHPLNRALASLFETTTEVLTNPAGLFTYKYYTVPQTMTLMDVAKAIYQDASRSEDLKGFNVINNPMEIKAGAEIRYV